jgi:hypothetical protein
MIKAGDVCGKLLVVRGVGIAGQRELGRGGVQIPWQPATAAASARLTGGGPARAGATLARSGPPVEAGAAPRSDWPAGPRHVADHVMAEILQIRPPFHAARWDGASCRPGFRGSALFRVKLPVDPARLVLAAGAKAR